MRTAQCGSMEAEALSFVLRAAGGSMGAEALSFVLRAAVVNQARVYVCSGRAGGNERHLLFFARYEET